MNLHVKQTQELREVQRGKKDELEQVLNDRQTLKSNITNFVGPSRLFGKAEQSLDYPEL